MLRGWATRAVTVPALLLRSAVDLQAGVATAMIAALVLEHGIVPVADMAKWSILRASKPRPRALLFLSGPKQFAPIRSAKAGNRHTGPHAVAEQR